MTFWKNPAGRLERIGVALATSCLLLVGGWLLGVQTPLVVVISVVGGLIVLSSGWILYGREGWSKAFVMALLVVTLFVAWNDYAKVQAIVGLQKISSPPTPIPHRTIQIAPCPSAGETLARRSDGSYVCLYPLPSNPGTGPVLASPSK